MKENKTKTILPLGPYHPLFEEPEFFELVVEGETVVDVNINIGYNHRGIEKLAESKSFDQVTFLVERICGICSTSHPIAYVNAVENICDIKVPERAKYIRTIIGELERIHSHLLWVGLAGHFLGYNTVFMWAWKYREYILDIFEAVSGNRNHYAMMKVGGVRRDIEEESYPFILKNLGEAEKKINLLRKAVIDDPVLHARLKNVGILTKENIREYGALGPTARASGVSIDVRKDDPYDAYPLLNFDIIVQQNGDVFDKAVVRILEMFESIKMIREALKKMPKGIIDSKPKEVLPGEGIGRHEAPRGETFHYVRSDGTNSPVRHKVRAPSFMNVPTSQAAVIGQTVADATIILAAVDPCYCCTERMAAVERRDKKVLYTGQDLVRLSQEKTARMRAEMGIAEMSNDEFRVTK